jgi:hypothetical protein
MLEWAPAGNQQERLNDAKVLDAVKTFIPRLAQYEGLHQDEPAAEQAVWQAACTMWEAAGGCPLTAPILRSFYQNACNAWLRARDPHANMALVTVPAAGQVVSARLRCQVRWLAAHAASFDVSMRATMIEAEQQ